MLEVYFEIDIYTVHDRRSREICQPRHLAQLIVMGSFLAMIIQHNTPYLHHLISYSLRSQDLLSVRRARTELGKRAFGFTAPYSYNELKKDFKLKERTIITLLTELETKSFICFS